MSLSSVFQKSRVVVSCGVKISKKLIYTHKMSEKPAEHVNTNGFESKTPFLIGVAGGTASGKVSNDIRHYFIDFCIDSVSIETLRNFILSN